jgi:hypothetical protein
MHPGSRAEQSLNSNAPRRFGLKRSDAEILQMGYCADSGRLERMYGTIRSLTSYIAQFMGH